MDEGLGGLALLADEVPQIAHLDVEPATDGELVYVSFLRLRKKNGSHVEI